MPSLLATRAVRDLVDVLLGRCAVPTLNIIRSCINDPADYLKYRKTADWGLALPAVRTTASQALEARYGTAARIYLALAFLEGQDELPASLAGRWLSCLPLMQAEVVAARAASLAQPGSVAWLTAPLALHGDGGGATLLAEVQTGVALHLTTATQEWGERPALTISLYRPLTAAPQAEPSPLSLHAFPSMLSALHFYADTEDAVIADTTPVQHGWWSTIERACRWACDDYLRRARADGQAQQGLSGPLLARWHLQRTLSPRLRSPGTRDYLEPPTSGLSHGAAFALALAQALARAHLGSDPLLNPVHP